MDISIIIPTYKRVEKLERALTSVRGACSKRHEVIVVDDCPDGSAATTAIRLGARYIYKAGRDQGQSKSRNLGIQMAKGRNLVFLDDDDFFSAGGVDALYAEMREGVSVTFGDYYVFDVNQRLLKQLSLVTQDHLLICNQIPVGAYMMERSIIGRGFDESMRSHEDWEFLLCRVEWARWKHVSTGVVNIDKTENLTSSTEARRRRFFWADFISIYSRYPAAHLSALRSEMLKKVGLEIHEHMLGFEADAS